MFRIWVAENPEEGEGVYNANPYTMSPYVVKFSAKTPIHIGPRDEMFNYMTNEPVLLLKQAGTIYLLNCTYLIIVLTLVTFMFF